MGEFRYRLLEHQFSDKFIEAFERVAYKRISRSSDLITIHFSESMLLRDLLRLEESINNYYYESLLSLDTEVDYELLRLAREKQLIQVRKFTDPGSVEIFMVTTGGAIILSTLAIALFVISIIRTQRRWRAKIKAIDAKLLKITEQLIVTTEENQESLTTDTNRIDNEEAVLLEVDTPNIPYLLQEISLKTSQEVNGIIESMTSKQQSYVIAKSGDHIVGLENS